MTRTKNPEPEPKLTGHYAGPDISLGDSAYFRFGTGSAKSGTRRVKLNSGDVLVFGGPARLMYHGIDRILPGTSTLVPGGGRINLTLRRVTRP